MNAIDATDRTEQQVGGEDASLLTIILDTNPHAWALLEQSLPLSKLVANLLVFINAHLAINNANRVAVLASHTDRAEWLYPDARITSRQPGEVDGDTEMNDDESNRAGGPVQAPDNPNKYRPFASIEHILTTSLRRLIETSEPEVLSTSPATMMAGALTRALAYISKQTVTIPASTNRSQFNYSDPTSTAGGNDVSSTRPTNNTPGTTARILVISVSGDLADQYISIMNSIFACQRLSIPLDILKLAGDTVFLQQAADATGGIYIALDERTRAGLLQYLMFAYLPDQAARENLNMPGESEGVDFRAACFCHRRVLDIGFVCSICLSIFCEPLVDNLCLTCGSQLTVTNYGQKPVVVPKKKKKKALGVNGKANGSRVGTPAPA